jgi:hypothetical protein
VLFSADWMQLWRYWCDLWFIFDVFDEYLEVVDGEGEQDAYDTAESLDVEGKSHGECGVPPTWLVLSP